MPGLKRSLHPPVPRPGASGRVGRRDPVLHEGFAIPQCQALVSIKAEHAQEVRPPRPEVKPYERGSYGKAMGHALDPSACRAALLSDALASTSKGPLASRIKRWEQIARQAGFPDPFDLSPDLIYTVMGAFKLADYRSADQYMEAAKSLFIQNGGTWTSQLRLAARAAARSCKRGQGCPKQAKGLPMVMLGTITMTTSLSPDGPAHPGRATLLASWWLLREIEASQARRKHVTIDAASLKVTWRLPSSKADWKALGAERSHRCSCEFSDRAICPYHCMVSQLDAIGPHEDGPLFPTSSGNIPSKRGWAATFTQIAAKLQLPTSHPNGAPCFTGHSARVTGAMHMASLNIELWRIQLFGRWSSEAFLLYIRDAPLAQLDNLAAESTAQMSIQAAKEQLKDLLRQVETHRAQAGPVVEVSQNMLTDCEAALPALPAPILISDKLVRNRNAGGKVHLTLDMDPNCHPREWRTRCSWRFALHDTDYEFVDKAPDKVRCRKCFPHLRSQERSMSNSSSSNSSSSSSSSSPTNAQSSACGT